MRYQHFYKGMYVVEGVNSSVVEATNRAAKYAKGDILLYLSDDFKCPDNWGASIYQSVKDFGPVWLLKVDDCLQQFEVPVLTIPIARPWTLRAVWGISGIRVSVYVRR